jgi:hypothetical protein
VLAYKSPAFENKRSDDTDVAGIEWNIFAKVK